MEKGFIHKLARPINAHGATPSLGIAELSALSSIAN